MKTFTIRPSVSRMQGPRAPLCEGCGEYRRLSYGSGHPEYRKCDCGFFRFDGKDWVFSRGPETTICLPLLGKVGMHTLD
jgi:hypothetical protein